MESGSLILEHSFSNKLSHLYMKTRELGFSRPRFWRIVEMKQQPHVNASRHHIKTIRSFQRIRLLRIATMTLPSIHHLAILRIIVIPLLVPPPILQPLRIILTTPRLRLLRLRLAIHVLRMPTRKVLLLRVAKAPIIPLLPSGSQLPQWLPLVLVLDYMLFQNVAKMTKNKQKSDSKESDFC